MTSVAQGVPSVSQVDPTINFNWGTGLVTPTGADYVSIRWSGKIKSAYSELYTFFLTAENGARLLLQHNVVINGWDLSSSGAELRTTFLMTAGTYYEFMVEWRSVTGPASVKLEWSSKTQARQVIPSTQLFASENIVGSPFAVNVLPGAADFPYSSAIGAALTVAVAGTPAAFEVQARDATGNAKTSDDGALTVLIAGPSNVELEGLITYSGGGLYRVVYTPTVSATYSVSVLMGGSHIQCGAGSASPCSPFTLVVAPGIASAVTSNAVGPGLTNAQAGHVATFTIFAIDAEGNSRHVGGDLFTVNVLPQSASGSSVTAAVVDNSDGTYTVTYTPFVVGSYTIDARLDSRSILAAGVAAASTSVVVHGELHGPTTTAVGAGLSATVANALATFTVHSKDAFSNDRTGSGGGSGNKDVFDVLLSGPGTETFASSSAALLVSITATSGTWRISVGAAQSPALSYNIEIWALERQVSYLLTDPYLTSTAAAGQVMDTTQFVRVTVDSVVGSTTVYRVVVFGHSILNSWDPSVWSVASINLAGAGTAATIASAAATGLYPIIYNIHMSGSWTLEVIDRATGAHIAGSPFAVVVAVAPTNSASSTASGQGLVGGVAGTSFGFLLQLVDARVPEAQLVTVRAVSVTRAEVQAIVCQASAGSFTVNFRAAGRLPPAAAATVAYSATLAQLATALTGLGTIDTVTVSVPAGSSQTVVCRSSSPDPVYITFTGPAVTGLLPDLTVNGAGLTGSVVLDRIVDGAVDARYEQQAIVCGASAGNVAIAFGGSSVTVAYNALVSGLASTLMTNLPVGTVTVTVPSGSVQTTICANSATPSPILVTFQSLRGNQASLVVTSVSLTLSAYGAPTVSEVVSGVSPVWGTFQLAFAGDLTTPLAFDAGAATVRAALAALPGIGDVTVTASAIGTDSLGRNGVTQSWSILYDVNLPFPNAGSQPLLVATWDASTLLYQNSGQLPPAVEVVRLQAGIVGNVLVEDDDGDLSNINLLLSHSTLTQTYVSLYETQTILCIATGGSVMLDVLGAPVTVSYSATLLSLQSTLTNSFGLSAPASIVVSDTDPISGAHSGATAVCDPSSSRTVFISFVNYNSAVPVIAVVSSTLTTNLGRSSGSVIVGEAVKVRLMSACC